MAQANGVCNGSLWTGVLVVDAYDSFDPLGWLEDGLLASGGFNLYLKKHMLKGEAVPLALLSLVTMTLLSFLIWRLWGCLCCCFSRTRKRQVPVQFELSKPWLRFWRWMAVVCALASVAMCAASMIKFPKHILSHPKQRVDAALVFGGGVLDAADAAAAQVQAIVPALGAIRGVLDVDVNASSIKAAIQALEPFVVGLPDPAPIQSSLVATDTVIQSSLRPGLSSLSFLLANVSSGMVPSLSRVSGVGSLTTAIRGILANYDGRLGSLPGSDPGPTSSAVSGVVAAQNQVALQTWLDQLDQAEAAANLLQAASQQGVLRSLGTQAPQLQQNASACLNALGPLETGLQVVHALDPVAAAGNMTFLAQRLRHIDATVVKLDNDTTRALQMLSLGSSGLGTLYSSTNSTFNATQLLSVLQAAKAQMNLATAADLSSLVSQMDTAADQLDAASSNMGSLTTYLEQVKALLNGLSQSVTDVGAATTQYLAAPSPSTYSSLLTTASAARGLVGPAASELGQPLPAGVPEAMSLSSQTNSDLSAANTQLTLARTVVSDAQNQLKDYPSSTVMQQYVATLGLAAEAYDMLPVDRMQLLDAPVALLDRAIATAESGIDTVQTQAEDTVAEVTSEVHDARVDVLWKVGNKTDDAFDTARKFADLGYKGWMGANGLLMLLVLLLVTTVLGACPCGLTSMIIITKAGVLLWLIIGGLLMAGMVVLQDGCAKAEAIIVQKALEHGPEAFQVANFYLNGEGSSLEDVLKRMGVVDIRKVQSSIDSAQLQLISQLQGNFTLGTKLSSAVLNVSEVVDDAQAQVDGLLALAGFEPVHAHYLALKSALCCEGGALLFSQWILVTGSCIFAWLATLCAKNVLARLDRLPMKNCLGVQCFSFSEASVPEKGKSKGFWGSWGGATNSTGGGSTSGGGISDDGKGKGGKRTSGGRKGSKADAAREAAWRKYYFNNAGFVPGPGEHPIISRSFDADIMASMAMADPNSLAEVLGASSAAGPHAAGAAAAGTPPRRQTPPTRSGRRTPTAASLTATPTRPASVAAASPTIQGTASPALRQENSATVLIQMRASESPPNSARQPHQHMQPAALLSTPSASPSPTPMGYVSGSPAAVAMAAAHAAAYMPPLTTNPYLAAGSTANPEVVLQGASMVAPTAPPAPAPAGAVLPSQQQQHNPYTGLVYATMPPASAMSAGSSSSNGSQGQNPAARVPGRARATVQMQVLDEGTVAEYLWRMQIEEQQRQQQTPR